MGAVVVEQAAGTPEEVLAGIKRRFAADPIALFESQLAPAPAAPTTSLCAWLRSLRLPLEPVAISPRWAPSRPQGPAHDPGPPPYIVCLTDCLERIGIGMGTVADAARVLAWLPNGAHSAQIVRDQDQTCGEALLLELKHLQDACRPHEPLSNPQRSVVIQPSAQGFPSLITTAEA